MFWCFVVFNKIFVTTFVCGESDFFLCNLVIEKATYCFTIKICNLNEKIKDKSFTENQLILKMNVYLKEINQECNKLYKEVLKSKDKQINYEMKKFEMLSTFEEDEGSERK